MEKQGYPKLAEHSKEHERFSNIIIEMKKEYTQGKMNLSLDILVFLKHWLSDHMLVTDADYGHYVASKGVIMEMV